MDNDIETIKCNNTPTMPEGLMLGLVLNCAVTLVIYFAISIYFLVWSFEWGIADSYLGGITPMIFGAWVILKLVHVIFYFIFVAYIIPRKAELDEGAKQLYKKIVKINNIMVIISTVWDFALLGLMIVLVILI